MIITNKYINIIIATILTIYLTAKHILWNLCLILNMHLLIMLEYDVMKLETGPWTSQMKEKLQPSEKHLSNK